MVSNISVLRELSDDLEGGIGRWERGSRGRGYMSHIAGSL